jgi:hypothetical protein
MPRKSNAVRTTTLRLSTTPQVVEALERLAQTGFHGKNPAGVAEEILRQQVFKLLPEVEQRLPPRKRRK